MNPEAHMRIIGDDDTQPWQRVEIDNLIVEWQSADTLRVTGRVPFANCEAFCKHVRSSLPRLAARSLWNRLRALRFVISGAREVTPEHITLHPGAPVRLHHAGEEAVGLEPMRPGQWDIASIRDEIAIAILAGGDQRVARILQQSVTLLYALEGLIRAVLQPENALPHMYKAIEVVQNHLGRRTDFQRIGVSKAYVDFVMSRANSPEFDERHAPNGAAGVQRVCGTDKQECLSRTRTIIQKFAASLS